jgi:hypothetical protein
LKNNVAENHLIYEFTEIDNRWPDRSGGQLPSLTQNPHFGSQAASFKGRTLTADNSLWIELAK